jgi:hypothetical protein
LTEASARALLAQFGVTPRTVVCDQPPSQVRFLLAFESCQAFGALSAYGLAVTIITTHAHSRWARPGTQVELLASARSRNAKGDKRPPH